jgi:hypothetical protein
MGKAGRQKKKTKRLSMLRSRRGEGTGFAWIYGLVTLFGLGILYVVFNQVLTIQLVPIIKAQVNNSYSVTPIDPATIAEVNAGIDKYMTYFHILPFVLFFVVIIYMVIVAIRKERESEFQ